MRGRAAILALAMSVVPGEALAHGRPPRVSHVAFVPAAPTRIVARGTWGLVLSDDDGATWSWICAAAYGVDATIEDPDVHPNADGSIVLGSFGGLFRSRLDRCEWSQPEPRLANTFVIDVAAAPDDPGTLYALETGGGAPDQLHVSFDEGVSFAELGSPVERVLLERVLVAPSDPTRLYVSGAEPVSMDNPARRGVLFRSDDGGQTLLEQPVTLIDEERNVHLLAIDPSDPDRLLVRMTRRPIDPRPERVLLSEDGGGSFVEVLAAQSISGAVFSADGGRAWVGATRGENADGGPPIGLFRSDDGARSFTRLNARDVTCVARRGDEIWICADEPTDGFSLARSDDGGDSFTPRLRFEQIGELLGCDACSLVGFVCPGWYPDLAFDLQLDAGAAALPDGSVTGAPRDASPPTRCVDGSPIRDGGPGVDPPGSGCACAAGSRGGPTGGLWMALVALALWRRRIDARTAGSVH